MRSKIITTMMLGITLSAYSQYFGTPIYTEGFDTDSSIGLWIQTDEAPGEKTRWEVTEKKSDPFSAIDPASKKSAMLNIASKETKVTLISPEIDLAGKTGLQIGFYGYELSFCLRGNVDFRFSVSADGERWTDLFNALEGSSYTGERVSGWNLYKYNLPSEFEGKKVRLRFYVDASTAYGYPGGLPGYIDGIFISELPKVDLETGGLNFSTNKLKPTFKAYGSNEQISFTIRNVGVAPVDKMDVYYAVNGGERVVETFIPSAAIEPGASAEYRFATPADLSKPRGKFTIAAGVVHPDDANVGNDQVEGYAENMVSGIPYIPDFLDEADNDGWDTDDDGSAYWDYEDWKEFYWYIEPEYSRGSVDAWLISRPVLLEKGKTYRVNFSVFEEEDGDGENRMAILAGRTADMEDAEEIDRLEAINDSEFLEHGSLFECEETGPYYFFFRCLSDEGAGRLRLENISFYHQVNADIEVTGFDSPKQSASLYSDRESISVRIANKGAHAIAPGDLGMKLYIDGECVASESNTENIKASSASLFTFSKQADLSIPGKEYELKVEAELKDDEEPRNNSLTVKIESLTAAVPYIPDFGDASEKTKESEYWIVNDKNNDGYSFVNSYDPGLDMRIYSYGGGMIGLSYVTIPESDESLMTRGIKLSKGAHKIFFKSFIGKSGASMPLALELYKDDDGKQTFVKTIRELNVDNSGEPEFVIPMDVDAEGIYRVGFEVRTDKEIDYRIYLADFRISGDLDYDMSVEDIIIPTDRVSSITEFPVGAVVRNNGSNTVTTFVLSAEENGEEVIRRKFQGVSLAPDSSYEVYFSEMYEFDSEDTKRLNIKVKLEGDEYSGNDGKSVVLSRREAENVPYSPEAHLAMDEWGAYNYNCDLSRFRKSRMIGNGYLYESDGEVAANDMLASPGIELEEDATYAVSFSYYVNEGDATDFTVSAYDKANDTTVTIAEYHNATQNTLTQSTQYFTIPQDGIYNICFNPEGEAKSLFVSSSIRVAESEDNPDIQVSDIVMSKEEAVFGENEIVDVELCNIGDVAVQGVPVSLTVGDKVYYTIHTRYFSPDDENVVVRFNNVDLSEPGEYELVARADVGADDNPRDNVYAKTVKSLPVVDLALCRIINPESGRISETEKVTVEVENLGKGTLRDVALVCNVVRGDDVPVAQLSGIIAELKDHDKIEYTFDDAIDLSAKGIYTIAVNAEVAGDVDMSNNLLTVQVNSTREGLDAGVTAIAEPSDGVLTDGEHLTITVRNYCGADLFSVPVEAVVKNPEGKISAILQGTVAQVKAMEDVNYRFDDEVDMLAQGAYSIEARTLLAADTDRSNDKCTAVVKCLTRDLGVTAILSPESGEQLGECDVTIEITNFGEAPVSGFPVSYQIGAMPQLATVHEEIGAGETLIYTFPVKYEFVAYRNYAVTASTLLKDDYDPTNDEMVKEIENRVGSVENIAGIEVTVSPNPSRGMVTVTAGFVMDNITLYDMSGRIVYRTADINSNETTLSLGLSAGNYVMIVKGCAGDAPRAIRLVL